MADILRFPSEKIAPAMGLTHPECAAIRATVYDLIHHGRSTGVSFHNDGQFMCVFDHHGQPYFIGREESTCLLFDPDETLLAESRRFDVVLEALDATLSSSRDRQVN